MAPSATEPEPIRRIWFWDLDRVRARFRVPIALKEHADAATDRRAASAEDLAAFEKMHPASARQLHALRSTSYIATSSGLAGALLGGILSHRAARVPQFTVIAIFLGGFGAAAVADDFSSWIYGTYKFDIVQVDKTYRDFMNQRYPRSSA